MSLPLGLLAVAVTLALAGLIVIAVFTIRRRLMDDPDLQEFVKRVEAGRAGPDEGDDSPTG